MLEIALVLITLSAPHQAPESRSEASRRARLGAGDAAHYALDPGAALARFERLLAEDSTSYDALWRAAREEVNLGMLASDPAERKRRAEAAVGFARRARKARPAGPEGAEWLAVALGRLALEHGPRTRARLAVEIRDAALTALELDSLTAGAHHVLGEWHAEIRRLSGIERWAARRLLGARVVELASWDRAIEHLERATRLAPEALVHHLDLARAYADVDRGEDARRALREVIDRPVLEPVDPQLKRTAERLLAELRSRLRPESARAPP